ncbi:hypothetical protein ACFPTR_02680 [Aliibacillus thermotolerans]|uniref:Uncharacterized protein n=1 Tax=Aliibacillus thermotolerans TaxID=1834418 RepID=A0ABW0U3U0_9BACI|nr:hypothetical protein [Aliibacillus thermotolerans]MDA3129235.1 hypothetical protein [Aliibacillus thermotolerans]
MSITEEDHMMIHYFILLPLVKTVLEKDRQLIANSSMKIKEPYFQLIESALQRLHRDMRAIKQFMQKHRIQVLFQENDGTFSRYSYTCRGYEGKSSYLNANLKRQAKRAIDVYFTGSSPLQHDHVFHS